MTEMQNAFIPPRSAASPHDDLALNPTTHVASIGCHSFAGVERRASTLNLGCPWPTANFGLQPTWTAALLPSELCHHRVAVHAAEPGAVSRIAGSEPSCMAGRQLTMAVIFRDSGGVSVGSGDYVGSVVDGIVYSDSGGISAGSGDYVGSVVDGIIYSDSGGVSAGSGDLR